jgi:hypothetical protein
MMKIAFAAALLTVAFAASAEAARRPGPWEVNPRRQCLLDAGGQWDRFGRVRVSLRHVPQAIDRCNMLFPRQGRGPS